LLIGIFRLKVMIDFSKTLGDIELKARQLVLSLEILTRENQALQEENQQLKNNIEELIIKNKTLKETNNIQYIAGVATGKQKNTIEAKKKINEFVREIDKCISLLNQ
jgi:hypothetical protein